MGIRPLFFKLLRVHHLEVLRRRENKVQFDNLHKIWWGMITKIVDAFSPLFTIRHRICDMIPLDCKNDEVYWRGSV